MLKYLKRTRGEYRVRGSQERQNGVNEAFIQFEGLNKWNWMAANSGRRQVRYRNKSRIEVVSQTKSPLPALAPGERVLNDGVHKTLSVLSDPGQAERVG